MNRVVLFVGALLLSSCKEHAKPSDLRAATTAAGRPDVAISGSASAWVGAASPLVDAVRRGDVQQVTAIKRVAEADWSPQWRIVSMKETEVDHWVPGVLLKWVREEGSTRRTRVDAFASDGTLRYSQEELAGPRGRIASGNAYVDRDHRLRYRDLRYEIARDGGAKSYYYELESFGPTGVSIYRSRTADFHVDPYDVVPTFAPPDAALVSGPRNSLLETLRNP